MSAEKIKLTANRLKLESIISCNSPLFRAETANRNDPQLFCSQTEIFWPDPQGPVIRTYRT